MLDVLSQGGMKLCDRVSRRTALQVGSIGTMGLGLPQLLASKAAAKNDDGSGTFGRAKRVILLFMWGGPAHQDTWDLKPDGPVEMKGEFQPISTNVPGIHISEHFPHLAKHADKLAIIRSVGQEDNNHSTGAHAGLTGRRHELKAENFGARDTDFPHFGSVLSNRRPNQGGVPTFVALPDIIATTAGKVTPGQGGGILGRKYDPFHITDHPDEPDYSIAALKLPSSITNRRMHDRRNLLSKIDDVARLADRSDEVYAMNAFYQQALDMVISPAARDAFQLDKVAEEERWRFGWHTFGQSLLLARRLVETGVQLVTVYWHREKPTIDSSWDTHSWNFQEMKNRLMPSVDRSIATLLEDLEAKGLLDETLVVWNSEFGRTPKINARAGRDHWGPCNSIVMAGGGVPGGQVFGASDKAAAYPTRDKVTQDNIAATIYHLLGLDPESLIHDRLGRPHPIALGDPMMKLLRDECPPEQAVAPTKVPAATPMSDFRRMLFERARRYLVCEFGNAESEKEWTLTGWGEPVGNGTNQSRALGDKAATAQFVPYFFNHFDYGYLVIRLDKPQKLDELKLSINGKPVPLPEDLTNAAPQRLWQIPIPPAIVKSSTTFSFAVTAPNWNVTDFAVCGDHIREQFVARYEV